MDRNADELGKPLLLPRESSYTHEENEFQDVIYNPPARAPAASADKAMISPRASAANNNAANANANSDSNTSSDSLSSQTSYFGKVSPLSTGMLFPSPRGIVDTLPHPTKPCLLFADHDPFAAVSHICLLEKEAAEAEVGISSGDSTLISRMNDPKLFTVVHVCEALVKHEDPGMRILNKINKSETNTKFTLELPVLLHEGNIFQDGQKNNNDGGQQQHHEHCLLIPEYIDGAIGKKNLLRPEDPVGLYNMNLFIQRHSQLPTLFHQLLTHPSPNHRIHQLSKQLLNLLKTINSDLQTFTDGPYLCGKQFTLADICIFPIIERIVVVLSTYRSFWIPPSLTHLIEWYDIVSDRPSVRAATADRSAESRDTYCYERVHRNEYLIEVYECCARHEEGLFGELNDARGCAGVNVYRQVVEDEMRDVSICERKKCQPSCVVS